MFAKLDLLASMSAKLSHLFCYVRDKGIHLCSSPKHQFYSLVDIKSYKPFDAFSFTHKGILAWQFLATYNSCWMNSAFSYTFGVT